MKPYLKSKRAPRFKLEPELVPALLAHVEHYGLCATDLFFRFDTFQSPAPGRRLRVVEDLGRTEPNATGRTYTHGSLSAYTAGRCRCPHCRAAFAE